MHGEYEAFIHMLKSASGMIKIKTDLVLGKTVSAADREKLAELIYYPEKEKAYGNKQDDRPGAGLETGAGR